jgi:phosphate-selective porin OprO/OprP
MSRKKLYLSLAALGYVAAVSPSVFAANDAMQDLLKVLKDKGTIDEATYESLKGAATADDEQNTAGQSEIKAAAKSLPKIETKGKLEWGTPDGAFTWRLGGRLHLDGTFYDNDNGTEMTSGVDVRRARLEFQSVLWQNWMFKLDYEFGQTPEVKDGFRDAYIRYLYKGPFPTTVTVGQFKEYLGLEHANSSNDLPFVERALPSRVFHDFAEASDGRRMGVGVTTMGHDLWTASAGVFGKNFSGDSTDENTDPFAFEGRLTFSPIHTETQAVHLGFTGNWININGQGIKFAARPEERIGAQRLIDTGDILGVDDVVRIGAEAGVVYGPFWAQGEYLRTDLSRPGLQDVGFWGAHGEAGWVITGESRIYDFEKGTFKNPKPFSNVGQNGGWGAWEVAARYSHLDLSDGDIDGGQESNFAAGLNWYLNQNFRLMFTYDTVLDVNRGKNDGVNPSAVLLRAQAYW